MSLRCGGLLSAVKNIHDLPLSSGKHRWLDFVGMTRKLSPEARGVK
jgi:hypothetical protein